MILKEYNDLDFQNYRDRSGDGYALEIAKVQDVSLDEAKKKSSEQFKSILPDGLATKNHFFYKCVENNNDVGMIWFYLYKENGITKSFIYDFYIWNEFRGKGYSKTAISLAEDKCKALGANNMGLHVFLHNHVAYNLYKKMRYEITKEGKQSVEMGKRL